jgi:hypothetical protein
MNSTQYTVLARNRPIQVAFLINTDALAAGPGAFNQLVDALVDWNYTRWGGRTNPIIFFSGTTLREEDWQCLEVADPDCITVFGSLDGDLMACIDQRLQPWGLFVNDKPITDSITVPHEVEGICVPPTPTNLRRLQGPPSIRPEDEHKLLMFEFASDCDPDAKRFVDRNFGTFPQWLDRKTQKVRRDARIERCLSEDNTHQITISDQASLAVALTKLSGRMRHGDSRPALSFIAPCQLASMVLEGPMMCDSNKTYRIVIGDTPADFAEFWNSALIRETWFKTCQHQLWIPKALMQNSSFQDALQDWLRRYCGVGSPGRKVELISHSVAPEELEKLHQSLSTANPPITTRIPCAASIEQERRKLKEEEARVQQLIPWDARTKTERLTGFSSQQRFQISRPEILEDDLNGDGNWMVDLQIEHSSQFTNQPREQYWWHLPRRNSGRLLTTMFHAPARINRQSRFSVRVERHNRLISPVATPEVALSIPADVTAVRSLILHPKSSLTIQSCRNSEKGDHLSALIKLFGDFWTAKSFCERRFWRLLFRQLAGHGAGDDDKLHGHVKDLLIKEALGIAPRADEKATALAADILHLVRGRLRVNYLGQQKCQQIRARLAKETPPEILSVPQGDTLMQHFGLTALSMEQMQQGLNDLLEMGILRLGVENTCPTCKLPTWYHVNDLRQELTCGGCGSKHSLRATEQWSYSLNTLAQTSVSQGVLGVLHALAAVASHAHDFFIFSPSLELFRPSEGNPWHEVDVLCVANGDFIIGEVKEGFVRKRAFEELAEVAEVLLPQRAIIFLSYDRAKKQWKDLNDWLTETRSRLDPKGISAEIFALPEY